MVCSPGPGNIHLEQVGVNGLGQSPLWLGNGTGSVKHSQSYARGQGVASILTNPVLAGSVNHSFTEDSGVPEWVKENGPVRGGCALVYVLAGFSSHPDWHKQYMVICKSFAVHTPSPLGVNLFIL